MMYKFVFKGLLLPGGSNNLKVISIIPGSIESVKPSDILLACKQAFQETVDIRGL